MTELGKILATCGYFQDAKSEAQAVVKVLAGQEIGLPPIASMTGIYIVQGRVTIGAQVMAGLVKRSKRYDYRVRKLDDTGCHIEFFENGESLGLSTFDKEDAAKAKTGNLDKFPRNMFFARAMSNGCKWHCADLFSGGAIYTPDELGANVTYDAGGNLISVKETAVPDPEPAPPPRQKATVVPSKPAQPAPKIDATPPESAQAAPTDWTSQLSTACDAIRKQMLHPEADKRDPFNEDHVNYVLSQTLADEGLTPEQKYGQLKARSLDIIKQRLTPAMLDAEMAFEESPVAEAPKPADVVPQVDAAADFAEESTNV